MANPKVFISYSHDSKEHADWVLQLATHLRSHGVDIVLDQWNLKIGDDLPFFMENGLNSSKLVICVCSDDYVKKSDYSIGGVGYEKNIIVQPLLRDSNANHIIPLVRNNGSDQLTPIFLGTKKYTDFRNNDNYYDSYTELISRIYNQDTIDKPPLGINPFETNHAKEIIKKLNIEAIEYQNCNNKGTVSFNYERNSGLFIIGTGSKSFLTSWSSCGADSLYAYRDKVKLIGYNEQYNKFPTLDEIIDYYNFSSRTRCIKVNEIIIWINNDDYIAATKILSISNKERGHDKSEIVFEYKIYDDIINNI